MAMEEVKKFDVFERSDKLLGKYLKQLGYEDEFITTMRDLLDTIEEIMERREVHEKSIEWDEEGLKLDNKGNVVLPGDMSKILDEIIKENALYGFFLPEKYGGFGQECNFMIGPMTEKLAYYDLPLQMLIMVGFTILEPMFIYYKPEYDPIISEFAKGERLGYVAFTEPNAGSNLKNVKSTSEKVGDEYVLNGNKIFISNGGYANTGLFLAQNIVDGEEDGTNVFLVDNLDNIEVTRLEEKTGLHANPTAELKFDNVTVPEHNLIASRGNGYKKVLERLLGMRVGVAFQASAASKRAYDLSLQYAQNREQFNKPIIEFDAVSRKLESMRKQIPRMDDFNYRAAFGLDRFLKGWVPADVGAGAKPSTEEQAAKNLPSQVIEGIAHYMISSSKLYNTEISNLLLYDAVQIFGGMGFVTEMQVNKISRDIRVLPIYEGTSEIHEWILGRSIDALNMLPKFEKIYPKYEDSTIYERYLFDRFPDLEEKL